MFAIISAGRPYPPQDCGYTNKTSFIQITCHPGFDGGIQQSFILQVGNKLLWDACKFMHVYLGRVNLDNVGSPLN